MVDRSQLLEEAVQLVGIQPHWMERLQPVNLGAGRASYNLTWVDASGLIQTPSGIDVEDILDVEDGPLALNLYNGSMTLIDPDVYELEDDGFHFDADLVGPSGMGPSGATISCYQKATEPARYWALHCTDLYDGPNSSFNQLLISVDMGALQLATAPGGYYDAGSTVGGSGVRATYACYDSYTNYFIGDHPNWVTEHLRMWPDIFVGETDYPGDASEVDGIPFEPGEVPAYREVGTYSINARDGLVTFPEQIDEDETPVRANYAHLKSINNVTGQRLTAVVGHSGQDYQFQSGTAFADALGKRWVMQRSTNLPVNVYLNGSQVPVIHTVAPYDTLTVKLS